eukprot:GHVR01041359.1.p1 GENE.GHVR01041359.1~~GHVR01041359.1.p1  ORF type:complete len:118 (+),score=19.85 GHVR01041359.1:117-470(+)
MLLYACLALSILVTGPLGVFITFSVIPSSRDLSDTPSNAAHVDISLCVVSIGRLSVPPPSYSTKLMFPVRRTADKTRHTSSTHSDDMFIDVSAASTSLELLFYFSIFILLFLLLFNN